MERRLCWFTLLAALACSPKANDEAAGDTSTTDDEGEPETTMAAETSGDADTETDTDATETETDTETETGTDTDASVCSECEMPEVVAEGLVRCADGSINRTGPGNFDPTIGGSACQGNEDFIHCMSDAECTDKPHGACRRYTASEASDEFLVCGCKYACEKDDDCDPGSVCVPPDVVPGTPEYSSCVPYDGCQTNDDCAECGECGLSGGTPGCEGGVRFMCRTPNDDCRSLWDCTENTCTPSPLGWLCEDVGCTP